MSRLTLQTPTEKLFMVGQAYAQKLQKLNITTAYDLLHHYPFRYQQFKPVKIAKLKPQTTVSVTGQVISCQNIYTKKRVKLQKAIIKDSTGNLEVIWFNQPYLPQTLKPKTRVSLAGQTNWFNHQLNLISPQFEIKSPKKPLIHTAGLVSIYPETKGLSSKWLRSRIFSLLKNLTNIPDWLPQNLIDEYKLISLSKALKQIHFPDNFSQIKKARQRLAFDELLILQLESLKRKKDWQQKKLDFKLQIKKTKINQLINNLPFKLTSDQTKASRQILTDLKNQKPMNRLLQGDVGSGKTVVAAIAIYAAYLNGYQSVLMAPTEILANQHLKTLKTVFKKTDLKIKLVTSATKKTKKQLTADLFVGTHALLHRSLDFAKIGLVVIDEQHRFGVQQRGQLLELSSTPHLLTMTATPIPRTIALTFYADLDLSIIKKMPQNRKPVKTWVVPTYKKLEAYQWIKNQIKKNRSQAFIVCPLIEASETETLKDIKAAKIEFQNLKAVFTDLKLDLLHGRLKSKQKQNIISRFIKNQTHILVTTPVIEVGIDIPNAAIIMIEDADRFGLAQLHQLRGRVGRGDKKSYCLLFTKTQNPLTLNRLKHLETLNSGFKLAELDLKLRGPGELSGTKQHGYLDLKIASLTDPKLIFITQKAAQSYPHLLNQLKQRKITNIKPN